MGPLNIFAKSPIRNFKLGSEDTIAYTTANSKLEHANYNLLKTTLWPIHLTKYLGKRDKPSELWGSLYVSMSVEASVMMYISGQTLVTINSTVSKEKKTDYKNSNEGRINLPRKR